MEVDVRAFGNQVMDATNLKVRGFPVDTSKFGCPKNLQSIFGAVEDCLDFNAAGIDADVVHCHTWYTHLGGILAKLNYGIPLVITIHSLEPLRPWKREQLGRGYDCSSWVERTAIEMADAVVAVSQGTKEDVLRLFNVPEDRIHIIYNGIDPDEYRPIEAPTSLQNPGLTQKNRSCSSSVASPGKRGLSTWWTRLNTWSLASRWCSARAPRTRPRLRPK